MQKEGKYNILNHLPETFLEESIVNKSRIFEYNNSYLKSGIVVYICERELRIKDNFALQFSINLAKSVNNLSDKINKSLPLKVIYPEVLYEYLPKNNFIRNQLDKLQKSYKETDIDFEIVCKCILEEYLKQIDISAVVIDFNPILNRDWLKNMPFKLYEIDGHNIVPARFVSSKQEYNAFNFRKKIYADICPFFTEYKNIIDTETDAEKILKDFIKYKLPLYSACKNDPIKDVTSKLSGYLNFGFISSQRVAIEIVKSDNTKENKEAFLEELIIRKELADNFCLYNKNFKTLKGIPKWAELSLKAHINDIRECTYTLYELERGLTHDKIWNSAQKQLLKEGGIHGYLRMYWAKKVLEWSFFPEEAHGNLIYLNDRYSYDAPSPNGYTGILWSIAGVHDRAFKDWKVTGKIRRMTSNSLKKKFDITTYIERYG